MNIDKVSDYLSQILGDGINLTVDDLDSFDSMEDKELAYGLICLSEDLEFYKAKSETTIANLKSALFNSSSVVLTNSEGIIKSVNEQFALGTGFSEDELIGQSFEIINSGFHSDDFFKELWNTVNEGRVWRGEIRNKTKNSEFYWVETHIFPIKNRNGNITEFWPIRTDITEKKSIEAQLKETNKELKKALAAKVHLMKEMHHRIKNKLQLLSSMLKLKAKNSSPELEDAINDIISQINSIASVHEMLYKKAEQKNINLIRYLKLTFNEAKLSFSHETKLDIIGDELFVKIESCTYLGIIIIINELLTNSLKYAWKSDEMEGSEINIQYTIVDDLLILDYNDNGCGYAKLNSKEGLGTTLIDLLINHQLEGEYSIESENGFSIQMKIPTAQIINFPVSV